MFELKKEFQSVMVLPVSRLMMSMLRLMALSQYNDWMHTFATSALEIVRTFSFNNSSSTPRMTSLLSAPLSVSPPGWMMVYFNPDFIKYSSALRFHTRMLPDNSSLSTLPIVFKKLSGCVPRSEGVSVWVSACVSEWVGTYHPYLIARQHGQYPLLLPHQFGLLCLASPRGTECR